MWIYISLFCVPLVWAKGKENHGITNGFKFQDIQDVFFSHPYRNLKTNSRHDDKGGSSNDEKLIVDKFSPTGWVTKCRGLECISTTESNSAGNFLNKALDVLDKYAPQKSGNSRPTNKQDHSSSNSLATLLATTSGVINGEPKASKNKDYETDTKKSHGRIGINVHESKRQGWFEGNHAMVNGMGSHIHGLPGHHVGTSALNNMGMHNHGPLEPGMANVGMHHHGFYQPHVGMRKSIHVMDPAYGGMDQSNAGSIAHFHQPLPFPVIGPPAMHGHGHVHPSSLPLVDMNPPMNHPHHDLSHLKLNEPVVHVNQNPNMLLDGPVPPYPEIPLPGTMPGIHGVPVNNVPVPLPVPVPGPPRIEHFPVPVPGPTRVQHVPFPVPVPGPPDIRPVMVPVHSPPTIQKVPVPIPVQSPPQIHNVPFPVPVPVPSPPKIKEVPYPVRVPVQQPPVIQRFFYPVGIPQPGQVHHVPYPIYIRQPPEVQPVPYPVRIQSPPEKVPIPVPSEPEVVVQRVPYPVMVPQPGPIQEEHHHHEHYIVTQNGRCNINPCTNGGTCTAFEDSYKCHCQDGFKGIHCEDQSKCHPNPCRNLGTCTEVEKGYECTCQPGYKGMDCDITDPCSPSPCKNGGTCAEVGNSYTCDCRIGWIGKDCGIEAKCLPINPCQNGGTCSEAFGSYHCNCMSGWQGLSCEISAPDPSTDSLAQPKGGCDNCDPKAYCQDNICICADGYLGDGYTCDLVPHITQDKRVNIKNLLRKKNLKVLHKLSSLKRQQILKLTTNKARKASRKKVMLSHS